LNCWIIDTPDQWATVAARLNKAGYKPFQTQYGMDSEEGQHVTFWASGKPVVEFITHDDATAAAMLRIMHSSGQ
jgi:hypothetical protein